MNVDLAVVFNKSQPAKAIHGKADEIAGGAAYLRQRFLRDFSESTDSRCPAWPNSAISRGILARRFSLELKDTHNGHASTPMTNDFLQVDCLANYRRIAMESPVSIIPGEERLRLIGLAQFTGTGLEPYPNANAKDAEDRTSGHGDGNPFGLAAAL